MASTEGLSEVLSEFARTMVTDFPIQAILDRLVERIVEIMPVSGAGVTLIASSGSEPHYLAASNGAAMRFERLQSELSEGPCLAAYRTDGAVAVPDLRTDPRFAVFGPRAVADGLAAVFAFPLRHDGREALGALDLYRNEPGPLDPAAMVAAQTLADVAAAYIVNAQIRQDLQETAERSRLSSLHDPLTGLPNRVLFNQLIDRASARTRRSKRRFALLYADLDRFKDVNDRFGHRIGDELLAAVGERLAELIRPGDALARLSGDEFIILCEDLTDESEARRLADRVVDGMDHHFALSDHQVHVTVSVGIAYSGLGGDLSEDVLHDADMAMYQAKRKGGAQNQVLDLRERDRSEARVSLGRDLEGALGRGEIEPYFQPIVTSGQGQVAGFEALVRWNHPDRGQISPVMLIPLAEDSRVICDLGRMMLESSCRYLASWNEGRPDGGDPLHMAVNVSPIELLACDYVVMVDEILAETGVDPTLLTFEITESVLITDPARALMILRDLKERQVSLALDDFGTGYSSLGYLQDFPVDVLKIDREFILRLGQPGISEKIVETIIELAHALGGAVVAEGVETARQLEILQRLDCDLIQGYLFARPLSASQVEMFLSRRGQEPPYLSMN